MPNLKPNDSTLMLICSPPDVPNSRWILSRRSTLRSSDVSMMYVAFARTGAKRSRSLAMPSEMREDGAIGWRRRVSL